MEKLLVIKQVKVPGTNQVVATEKFTTTDQSFKQFKGKPNQAWPVNDDAGRDTGLRVFYKIKDLSKVSKDEYRVIKAALSNYNRIR